jgi:Heavy metal associated domain 2
MMYSVHSIPGRLRIKNLLIKDKPREAEAFCSRLQTIPGVLCAVANTVTGSVVIRYEPTLTDPAAILTTLVTGTRPQPAAPATPKSKSFGGRDSISVTIGQGVANAVVHSLVEKLVERSAKALVTALI